MGWLGMRVPPDRAKDHHDPRSATTPAAATIRAIADPASRDPAGPRPPARARSSGPDAGGAWCVAREPVYNPK